jgi:hypothetical protein
LAIDLSDMLGSYVGEGTGKMRTAARFPYSGQWLAEKPRKTRHDSRSIAHNRTAGKAELPPVRTLGAKKPANRAKRPPEFAAGREKYFCKSFQAPARGVCQVATAVRSTVPA